MAAPSVDLAAALVLSPPPLADWLVIAPVGLMIGTGALLMMLRKSVRLHGPIAIATLVLLVLLQAGLLWRVAQNGPVTMVMGRWLPPFGIAFTADLFGAALSLAAGIVALCAGFSVLGDIDGSGRRYGFFPFLMLLMAGVTGAMLTGDIFNLYVWFEVLLISSFGLLILGSEPEQIDGAVKYAILNLIGTTLFLIAIGYLYAVFGTLNMADIARKAPALRAPGNAAPLVTLTALFFLAFAMKAAAFPVNFWLPAAYHTPRITVSALFGGLLTKVGIYAMLRVAVMLFPVEREALSLVIGIAAVLTLVTGALGALAQADLRRTAGYLVIAGIGNMLAGLAIGTPAAIAGAILYALNSIVAMTALYLLIGATARLAGEGRRVEAAGLAGAPGQAGGSGQADAPRQAGVPVQVNAPGLGSVLGQISVPRPASTLGQGNTLGQGSAPEQAGVWSLAHLGGLWRRSPWLSATAGLLFLTVAGLPPLAGFWPKVMLLKAAIDIGAWWLAAAILLSAFLVTLTLARVFLFAFWRPQPEAPAGAPAGDIAVGEAGPSPGWRIGPFTTPFTSLPLGVLTALCILFGLFPEPLIGLSQDAAAGLADPAAYIRSVFPEQPGGRSMGAIQP